MAGLPERPPVGLPPLPPGWTEHTAPSGHKYYYNKSTAKSTYTRPTVDVHSLHSISPQPHPAPHQTAVYVPVAPSAAAPQSASFGNFDPNSFNTALLQQTIPRHQHAPRGGHGVPRGGQRGAFSDRRRQPLQDRPKHRTDIPNCAPWVLVRTKLGRRFVWNKETNESFWKFPPDVLKAVMDYDHHERERRARRERGEPSDTEEADTRALDDMERELAAAEAEVEQQIIEVVGDVAMENESEYEEVEVTDDEGEPSTEPSSKRQRTSKPEQAPSEGQPLEPMELGEDDIAWQLAQMEAMEAEDYDEEEEGLPLTEDDCKALFKELLDDLRVSPFIPWDKLLENSHLYEDERYKALPNMKYRKECFDEWARERIAYQKELKAQQQKKDPRIPYLAFLHTHATPKLYWPEFRRKFKKEPEMRDTKLADKEKEKLYREHIKRLALPQSTLKSDLSALLKAQPVHLLNRSSTSDTLPGAVLTDLRFISLPATTRDSLVETYISTLPPAPETGGSSAEQETEAVKKKTERERRERALAERERRVEAEKRRQERELAYGKHRLREEEDEIARAIRVGKDGLRAHLGDQ